MKMLIGLFVLALSFSSMASSGETKTFVYDGSESSVELLLRGEKTHTEYRYEQQRTICYRQETEWRTVCTGGGFGTDRNGRTYPIPRHCYQQPWTRTVSYPCTQTVQIPYEVKDYDVEARVFLDVANLSDSMTPGETFKVSLVGDTLSLDVRGSKKFFVMQTQRDVQSQMNGYVKYLEGSFAVELIEAAPIMRALSMSKISVRNSILTLNTGAITTTDNLGLSLSVESKRVFGSDTTLFDRALDSSEFSFSTSGNSSEVAIDMDALGVNLSGGKFGITAKTYFKGKGTLLNAKEFSQLEVSRTLIFTNR